MSQDINPGDNTPPPQQPDSSPPLETQPSAPQNPYDPPPPGYSAPPQNPYGPPPGYGAPPQNPYGPPPGYGAPPQNPYGPPPGYSAPLQNPYGPPPGYDAPPPGSEPAFSSPLGYQVRLTPLPLGQALRELPNQYRKVLTKPSVATFDQELRKASWDITVIQLLLYAVVAVIFGIIASIITAPLNNAALATSSNATTTAFTSLVSSASIGGAFLRILTVPIAFFIGAGVQLLFAKAFHGEGTFLTQCYTALLYQVPIGIIFNVFSLLAVIPGKIGVFTTGDILVFVILGITSIYQVVLNFPQIMAVHRVGGGKASGIILIPYGILFLLVLICTLGFAAIIVATLNSTR